MSVVTVGAHSKPVAEEAPPEGTPVPMPLIVRLFSLLAVIAPFLGLVAAIIFLWGWGLTWVELVLLAGMYAVTGFGITVGYHRSVSYTHLTLPTNREV